MSVVDDFLQADRLTAEGSLFAAESLQEVRDRLERIDATGCPCATSAHLNALHDLAITDVPALLRLIDHLAPPRTLSQRMRAAADVLAEVSDLYEAFDAAEYAWSAAALRREAAVVES